MDSTIIVALISLAGVVFTALWTKSSFSQEIDKKVAVLSERLDSVDEHVRSHNYYSQKFTESTVDIAEIKTEIKAIKEDIKEIKTR